MGDQRTLQCCRQWEVSGLIINYSNGFQLNCKFAGKPGQRRDVGNGVGYNGVLGDGRDVWRKQPTPH